jgi:hypothetical protein
MYDLLASPAFDGSADSDMSFQAEFDHYSAPLSRRSGGHWEGYFWVQDEGDDLPWDSVAATPARAVSLPW